MDIKINRFQICHETNNSFIRDTVNELNFATLCEAPMGLKSSTLDLAQEICDWLNKESKGLEY